MCLKRGEEEEKENKENFVHKEDLILKFNDLNMRNEVLKDHPKITVVILIIKYRFSWKIDSLTNRLFSRHPHWKCCPATIPRVKRKWFCSGTSGGFANPSSTVPMARSKLRLK